jgi:hypothetical protein
MRSRSRQRAACADSSAAPASPFGSCLPSLLTSASRCKIWRAESAPTIYADGAAGPRFAWSVRGARASRRSAGAGSGIFGAHRCLLAGGSGNLTIRYHFVCDERRQAFDRSGASIPFRASMCGVVHARAGRRAPPDRHPLHARRRPHPTQRTPGPPLGGQRPPRSASRADHPRRKQLPALRLDPRSRCARRRERGRTCRGDETGTNLFVAGSSISAERMCRPNSMPLRRPNRRTLSTTGEPSGVPRLRLWSMSTGRRQQVGRHSRLQEWH